MTRTLIKPSDVRRMGSHLPLGDRQACLPGVERTNIRHRRNSRVGIAARDIISTDYTFCTNCKYHLLARQDTAYSVCETLLRRFRVGSLAGRSKFPYAPRKTHPHTAFPVRFCVAYHRLGTLASICSQCGTSLHEKQLSTVFPSLSVLIWRSGYNLY